MNRWIQKEIRLLLPQFGIGLALIALAWLLPRQSQFGMNSLVAGLPLLFCPLIMVMLALTSFGREISTGMFSSLLAQPMQRNRIWWVKNLLLATSLGLLWYGWWSAVHFHFGSLLWPVPTDLLKVFSLLLLVTAFSGALFATLFVRQMAAAFWLTVLPPTALILAASRFLQDRVDNFNSWIAAMLAAYALLTWILAYRHFMQVQDSVAMGESLFLSKIQFRPTSLATPDASSGNRSPLWIWVHKELKLHQTILLLAIPMAVFHFAATRMDGSVVNDTPGALPNLGFVLNHMGWVLWLGFPLMLGATLIAEERRLGVWERQLTFPASLGRMLGIKFGIGLALAVLLGGVLPLVLEQNRLFPDHRIDPYQILTTATHYTDLSSKIAVLISKLLVQLPFDPQPIILLSAAAAGIFLISSFASSLCRSTLQALTLSLAAVAPTVMLFLWLESGATALPIPSPPFNGPIGRVVVIPTLALTLFTLMMSNARQIQIRRSAGWRNAAVLLIAVLWGITASAGIFHRAWEWFGPLEPAHGAAFFKQSDRIEMQSNAYQMLVTTADGRGWEAELLRDPATYWDTDQRVHGLNPLVRQLPGTNWTSLALCTLETVGIKGDGSLWISEVHSEGFGGRASTPTASTPSSIMTRFGNDTDWKQVVRFLDGALLLKSDGTLWSWVPRRGWRVEGDRGLREEAPHILSISSKETWAELFRLPNALNTGCFVLRSQTGRAWIHYRTGKSGAPEEIILAPMPKVERALERAPEWDAGQPLHQTEFCSTIENTLLLRARINDEGTLALSGVFEQKDQRSWHWRNLQLPLDDENSARWVGLTGGLGPLVTLRADGTLWGWRFPDKMSLKPSRAQLGGEADWVAVSHIEFDWRVVSLAADGTLWGWPDRSRGRSYSFLAPSSKPQLLGSILPRQP